MMKGFPFEVNYNHWTRVVEWDIKLNFNALNENSP